MSDRPVPAHWLRVNDGARSPHRVLFVDTETRPVMDGLDELHELRWWHARVVRRHVERPRGPLHADLAGDSAMDLAAAVDRTAITKCSLWLYTHNLGFDLQVTRLPELLHDLGWEVTDIGITGRSPWIRMAQDRRRLVICDSTSWLPVPLAEVGESIGRPKPVIDDWTAATDEEIAVRCLADVVILSEAMLAIMDWWDASDMGRWSWTGPGCGWAAYRHKFLAHKVLMDPAPERITIEREAIYGGRREAYRLGRIGPAQLVDLDFQGAYPTLAATMMLPRRPVAHVDPMTRQAYENLPSAWGVLSRCTVTTAVPVVPCRLGGHTLYPTGTFETTLAQPDIAGALAAGATVELGDTWVYQLAPIMAAWGKWITGVVNGTGQDVPAPVRTMCKHWSRTVIGRWAMRAQRVEDWGVAAWPWWHAEPGTDWDTGTEVVDLHACGRHLRIHRDGEPENVFPAVTAWIEAQCRQLLRHAMQQVPASWLVQCDTDGFMLDVPQAASGSLAPVPEGTSAGVAPGARLPSAGAIPVSAGPLSIRAKAFYTTAMVLGPQQVITGDRRRVAGIPRSFTSADSRTWKGNAWPGYTWQLAHSQPGIYTRPHVTIPLKGPYGSRWQLADNSTMAPECAIRNGVTIVIPPDREMLSGSQPEILRKLTGMEGGMPLATPR